jgi:hypothetical protein
MINEGAQMPDAVAVVETYGCQPVRPCLRRDIYTLNTTEIAFDELFTGFAVLQAEHHLVPDHAFSFTWRSPLHNPQQHVAKLSMARRRL